MRAEATQSDQFPTIPQAAKRLGIGRRQLEDAIKAGDLPVYQVGGWRRLRWSNAIHWIESRRIPVTAHARARVAEVLDRENGKGAA